MFQALPHHVLLLVFPAAMAMAAATDILSAKIPNRLSIALVVAFVLVAPFAGLSLYEMGMHLLCGAAILVVMFGLYSFGVIGGGDAKLVAATALWFGWTPLLDYFLAFSIIGGGLARAALGARWFVLPERLASLAWIVRWHQDKRHVPYGVALALGALMTYPETQVWTHLSLA